MVLSGKKKRAAEKMITSTGLVAALGILARAIMLCVDRESEIALSTALYLLLLVYLVVSSVLCKRHTKQTGSILGIWACVWLGFLGVALMAGVDLVVGAGTQLPGILVMLHLGILAMGFLVGREQAAIFAIVVALFLTMLGILYRDIGTAMAAIAGVFLVQMIVDVCVGGSQ